jgi:hypothetical protein
VSIQNYLVSGLYPLSGILNTRKQHFGNWMFSSSGEGRETSILFGPFQKANLTGAE